MTSIQMAKRREPEIGVLLHKSMSSEYKAPGTLNILLLGIGKEGGQESGGEWCIGLSGLL